MKALITGIAGFVGPYLAEVLLKNNIEVFGTYLTQSELENFDNTLPVSELFQCDLVDEKDAAKIFENQSFDYVFHLAAQSSVPQSFKFPKLTYNVNIIGTVNLLEQLSRKKEIKKIVFTSSSDVYGKVDKKYIPVNESAPLVPLNPYSISKISAEMTCRYFTDAYQLPIVVARAFNHSGPKQTPQFVIADFAKQIAKIELDLKEPIIKVGNLNAKRDFLDVRDVVRAYYLLALKGQPGEIYNVSSNEARSIQSILDKLVDLSSMKIKIKIDKNKIRPTELPVLAGDNSKLQNTTSWQQEIPFKKTLQDGLDHWRSVLKNS